MKRIRKIFISFCLVMILFTAFSSLTNAGTTYPKTSFFGNKYEVWKGKSSFTPDTSGYPFKGVNSSGDRKIDFFTLYGSSKDIIEYKGEIPYHLRDADDYKQVRVYSSKKIGSKTRLWALDGGDGSGMCSGGSKYNKALCDTIVHTTNNIEGRRNNDMHLWALDNYNDSFIRLDKILFWLVELITKLPTMFLNMIMELRGLNIQSIFTAISGDINNQNSLVNVFNRLFLWDTTNGGSISPFLLLCLIGFVIGITGSIIKGIKGNNAFAAVREDFLFFILSIVIVGTALAGGGYQIGGAVTNIVAEIEVALTNPTEGDNIFVTTTGDKEKDLVTTEKALLTRATFNAMTQVQFGYSVSELELNEKNFGSYWDTARKYITTDSDGYKFKVCTGEGRENNCSEPNLAYFLWAGNSNVNDLEPINGTTYNQATNDRPLFVIDYLNVLRNLDSNEIVRNKVDTIVSSMTNPNYMSGCATLLLLTVEMIFMILVLLKVILNVLLGKVMVLIVFFLLPVIGPLFLFRKSREWAKGMMMLFVTGFFRLTAYSLIFDTTLIVVSQVNEMGIQGILIAIVLLYVLKKFLPVISEKIDELIRSKQPRWANEASLGIRRWGREKKENAKNSIRNRRYIDKNGEEKKLGDTMLGKAMTGLSADDKAKFRQAINPVTRIVNNSKQETESLERIRDNKRQQYTDEANLQQHLEQMNSNNSNTVKRDINGNVVQSGLDNTNTSKMFDNHASDKITSTNTSNVDKTTLETENKEIEKQFDKLSDDLKKLNEAEKVDLQKASTELEKEAIRRSTEETRTKIQQDMKKLSEKESENIKKLGEISMKENNSKLEQQQKEIQKELDKDVQDRVDKEISDQVSKPSTLKRMTVNILGSNAHIKDMGESVRKQNEMSKSPDTKNKELEKSVKDLEKFKTDMQKRDDKTAKKFNINYNSNSFNDQYDKEKNKKK